VDRASNPMIGWAWTAAVVAALLAAPLVAARPVAAADVHVVLIARANDWHVGSPGATPKPTITVNPGDVLRLQVHNHDGTDHTFSFPHFGIDRPLAPGSDAAPTIIFVNLTTSPAEAGRWQFYCAVLGHSPGANESRVGMVGWVQVGSSPPAPGFEVLLVVAALGLVGNAVRALHRRAG
jgi:FtsP/CotA-like multicopper oxidase with cupredoxin domain